MSKRTKKKSKPDIGKFTPTQIEEEPVSLNNSIIIVTCNFVIKHFTFENVKNTKKG